MLFDGSDITADQLRRLVDGLDDAALVWLDPRGCIRSWNSGAAAMFGYSTEQAIGQTLALIDPTAVDGPLGGAFVRSAHVGRLTGDIQFTRRDGSCFAASYRLTPQFRDESLIGYTLVIRDADASRHLERSLRESEERYRNLVELAPDCIAVLQNNKPVYVNRAGLAAIKAGGLEQVLHQALDDYLHPADLAASRERQSQVLGQQRWLSLHHVRIRRLDGEYIDVETCAGPCMFNGAPAIQLIARDVTERIRNEEAARRRDAFRETVIRTAAEGICVCSAIDEFPYVRFSVWNDQMRELTGYTLDEINQLGWYQSLYPDETVRQRAIDRMARMRDGDDMHAEQWEITRRDGERRWVAISTSMVETEAGQPAVVAMIHDVTEQRRLEQQLQQSQKLEAIGRLAGGIAHDFNNLLSVIFTYSHVLLESFPPDDERRPQLEGIRDAGERAANLTRQLLAFSRQQPDHPAPLDLNTLIVASASWLQRLVGDDAEIITRFEPKLLSIVADRGPLEQVLMNLVINARDAMPRGGEIVITTANVTLTPEQATSRQLAPGPYVSLSVRDSGEGIPEAIQAQIFDPFFTTKEIGKGTGLGLAVVHGIVKQSGGQITFHSQPGQGTTFAILFPAVDHDSAPIVKDVTAVAPRGTETILVVDDDDGVRRSTCLALEGQGYRVLPAQHANQALEIVQLHRGPLDLLLTDVVMPGWNGPRLATAVSELRPSIRVLYMSGFIDPQRALGSDGIDRPHLQKPFTLIDLAQRVRSVLDQSRS
ncbi:MAG: PAS domain S-box protein [Planctomycetaceae bacterium]|nr:PAS domain S-box protein [Planctomycetaceae bacterium]